MKHLLPFALGLFSLSCASGMSKHVPLPPQDVELTSLFVSRVYVLEAPEISQGLQEVQVMENDLMVGTLEIGNYACWESTPGNCLIELTFDQMEPVDGGNVTQIVDANLEPGEVYYYGLTIDPLWKSPKVRLMTRAEARALLPQLTPVQGN
jgi:hypothetical protein